MQSKTLVVIASLSALLVTAACGDNRSPITPAPLPAPGSPEPAPTPNPTPTPDPNPTPAPTPQPGPSPTPEPGPTPPPTPGALLTFTPDTTAPASRSFSLQPAETNGDDLYVSLYAHDFADDTVNMVRANITFDPSVVSLVSFSSKESWMESFGYQAKFQVGTSGGSLIKIRVDAQNTFRGASGSGAILRLRFRKVATGNSRLDFVEASAIDGGYNGHLQATHGGTLVVK